MTKTATITSKRQLTIPVGIYRHLKLKQGQKVVVSMEDGVIKVEPALDLVRRLAGSVKVPKRFRGMAIDEVIEKAKKEYFLEKFKNDISRY